MIAALYVAKDGCYFNLPDVEPWDEDRDARLYTGPYPVVAHPPCERWGRYASGGPGFRGAIRPIPGNDGGCFISALCAARKWGGVIEHPADSLAWKWYTLANPPRDGGWIAAGLDSWTCCVDQGHYGHRARKSTWLYVFGPRPPELIWGPSLPPPSVNSTPQVLPEGRRTSRTGIVQRMSHKQRRATPLPFRDILIGIAENCKT